MMIGQEIKSRDGSRTLLHKDGRPVRVGDKVTSFRGEPMVVKSAEEPRHAGSSGHVYVVEPGDDIMATLAASFYPSVFDCRWSPAS